MKKIYKKRKCSLCHKTFHRFVPIDSYYIKEAEKYGYIVGKPETMNAKEYSCPYCYGADRDRLCSLFFKKIMEYKAGKVFKNVKLLDIAPSGAIQRFLFDEFGEITYDTADLFMTNVDYQVDIQEMKEMEDERYDLFICSHVLEHVKNDKKALRELYRILKADGVGILLVPLDLQQQIIDEEWGLPEKENWRRFGQGDHVRKYSKEGFIERAEEAGFSVIQLGQRYFGKKAYRENAINREAILYAVSKNKEVDISQIQDICYWFTKKHELIDNTADAWVQLYNSDKDEYNYYIDKAEIDNCHVYVWGWFYFANADSRYTKIRLLICDENKTYIWGGKLREREDIVETFGGTQNNYLYSGIEFEKYGQFGMDKKLYLLAENQEARVMFRIV